MNVEKKIIISVALVFFLVFAGTAGFVIIEHMKPFDALYMTVITLTTVGYFEVQELSTQGRVFNIFLIMVGVGTMLYLIGALAQLMMEGQLRHILGRRKVEKRVQSMKDHYIVCGFGRMGVTVCHEIKAEKRPLVVIEKQESYTAKLEEGGYLYIMGDATNENTLQSAGIEKAKGLVSVLGTDVENVYVTLTARGLNPSLYILARASDPGAEQKLKRAGASKVVSPYYLSGRKMAQELLKPTITNFIELVFQERGASMDLQMQELLVGSGSALNGMTLVESKIRQELNLIIVAIKKKTGDMLYNPTFDAIIEEGDMMIALGPGPNLEKLAERLNSRQNGATA